MKKGSANHRRARMRARRRRVILRRFVPVLCCLALLGYGGVRLTAYLVESARTRRTNAELEELFASETAAETESAPQATPIAAAPQATPSATEAAAALLSEYQYIGTEPLAELRSLYQKNPDLVGWVRIPGVVSLPVVYRDNSYYLTHDFDGRQSASGTLFLDEAHPLTAQTQYLVVHGHAMYDGSMFGLLNHYRKIDYVREHGLVSFSTLYRAESYVLFAVLRVPMQVNDTDYVAYSGTPVFESAAQFTAFVQSLQAHSLYDIPVDVEPSDALLTLSTCLDEDRLILVCRRLRENETKDEMQAMLSDSVKRG